MKIPNFLGLKFLVTIVVIIGCFVLLCLDKIVWDQAEPLIKWIALGFMGANALVTTAALISGKAELKED